MNNSPLGIAQREKSGSITFGKYEYQYHWALCRIIDEQRKGNEYALFVELHEDVVIANSLNCESASFEFNQVKNTSSQRYNINKLTFRKNGENSILGKLISSATNKPFSKKISAINLVASCGFKMEQLDNNLNFDVITIGDLNEFSIAEIKAALKQELDIDELPVNLRFIVPKLSVIDQQDSVIGKISKLISDTFPNCHCNAENIYRILIDDIHRKGCIYYDFNIWEDVINKKALTSEQVKQVINAHISLQDIQTILSEADQIANELDLSYLERKRLKRSIERIHIRMIWFPTSLNLKIRKAIDNVLSIAVANPEQKISEVVANAVHLLPDEVKKDIEGIDKIRDHIIYEIIVRDI